MTFRRDSGRQWAWKVWAQRNRDALVRCGVPPFLYADENRWFRFLEDDGWDAETGWVVGWLPPDQAVAFFDFVTAEYGDAYRGLLRSLEPTLRRPPTT